MGGPLSFLTGVGLVIAGMLQDANKAEEMRRYNEEKRANPYLKVETQQRLEILAKLEFDQGRNVGGIDTERLVNDIMNTGLYSYFDARNEAILLICKYLTETYSDYKYDRSQAWLDIHGHCISCEDSFDLSKYICEDWGKLAKFDPTIKNVVIGCSVYDNLNEKDIKYQIWIQARKIDHQRGGYMLGYSFFQNGNFPEWYETSWVKIEARWRSEMGL